MRHIMYLCGTKPAKMTSYRHFLCHLSAFVLLLAMALTACHDDGLSADQRAARSAAERCYKHLIKGHYDRFVKAMASSDTFSDDYRAQMEDLIHEHAARMEHSHGGLMRVEAVGDTLTGECIQVFLQLTFGDGTSEEVGQPMRCVDGNWLME